MSRGEDPMLLSNPIEPESTKSESLYMKIKTNNHLRCHGPRHRRDKLAMCTQCVDHTPRKGCTETEARVTGSEASVYRYQQSELRQHFPPAVWSPGRVSRSAGATRTATEETSSRRQVVTGGDGW